MAYEEEGSSSIGWFLAGLGLGALLGVLYAPKSGSETREDIANSAKEGRDYLAKQGEFVKTQAGVWVDAGKQQLDSYVEQGKNLYAQGVDQVSQYVSTGKAVVNDQINRVGAAVDAGKEAYVETAAAPSVPPAFTPSNN